MAWRTASRSIRSGSRRSWKGSTTSGSRSGTARRSTPSSGARPRSGPGRERSGSSAIRCGRTGPVSGPGDGARGPARVGRWERVESEWVFRSGFVSFRRDRCRLPDGRLSPDMYYMELRDFAMTVAVTGAGEVILSREYKHGAGDVAYTLPAGFIEAGEAAAAAARRELREEPATTARPSRSSAAISCSRASRACGVLLPGPGGPARDGTASQRVRGDRRRGRPIGTPAGPGASAPRYVTDVNSALVLQLALARLGGER